MKKNNIEESGERRRSQLWTKEEIKQLLTMWESCTKQELAEKLGREIHQVAAMAARIRQAGYHLPKKTVKGIYGNLINESLEELKLKKTR